MVCFMSLQGQSCVAFTGEDANRGPAILVLGEKQAWNLGLMHINGELSMEPRTSAVARVASLQLISHLADRHI